MTYTIQRQPAPGTCHYRWINRSAGKVLQDLRCNPGARNPKVTQKTIHSTICVSGYSSSIRPPSRVTGPEKIADEKAYSFAGRYAEYDHLVPLELGGDPNDPRNLWVEPNKSTATSYYNPKDAIENKLHYLVCSGKIPLYKAQLAIVTNWTTALTQVGYPPG